MEGYPMGSSCPSIPRPGLVNGIHLYARHFCQPCWLAVSRDTIDWGFGSPSVGYSGSVGSGRTMGIRMSFADHSLLQSTSKRSLFLAESNPRLESEPSLATWERQLSGSAVADGGLSPHRFCVVVQTPSCAKGISRCFRRNAGAIASLVAGPARTRCVDRRVALQERCGRSRLATRQLVRQSRPCMEDVV